MYGKDLGREVEKQLGANQKMNVYEHDKMASPRGFELLFSHSGQDFFSLVK